MARVRDDELREFLAYIVALFEHLEIPYMVVGGFAAVLYGEPRFTADIDVVVDMPEESIEPFVAALSPPDYYANAEAIRDSLRRMYPANVMQINTGAKVDLMPLPADVEARRAFGRRQKQQYAQSGEVAVFIAPEDLLLAKLSMYHSTQSERHLRDALGVLLVRGDDLAMDYLTEGAEETGVAMTLARLIELTQQGGGSET